jgi:hypothetical protein
VPSTSEESAVNDDAGRTNIERETEEPALTQRNSDTIRGEEELTEDETAGNDETAHDDAPAYGKRGGTTDATE